jgi:Fungal specific transcription factor domain
MGVATSVAHTIGLHRNPERSDMDSKRTKLWKRIWWSTYMRDRLIALGMRRPTRIKDGDYDVPMITLDDFEFEAIPESVTCVPPECSIARDVEKQRELAILCVQKAKLCLCISVVLSKQYCVLNNNQGMANDRTTMMLLPKKLDPEASEVKICDDELQRWLDELPDEARHQDKFTGNASMDVNRTLLHMVYYTTVSALHRPQVFPATQPTGPQSPGSMQLLDWSRLKVREAAQKITSLAQSLDAAGLVKFLPTTGVTVLLPAIIIHLLDIKAPDEDTRRNSLRGFCQCMNVVYKLRDMYAAADFSIAFLDAAVRKAGIQVSTLAPVSDYGMPTKMHPVMTVEDLLDAGRRLDMVSMPPPAPSSMPGLALTPPPDTAILALGIGNAYAAHQRMLACNGMSSGPANVTDEEVARRLETFLASTPPASEHSSTGSSHEAQADAPGSIESFETASLAATGTTMLDVTTLGGAEDGHSYDNDYRMLFGSAMMPELEQDDFEALLDLDGLIERGAWSFDDGGVHGFTHDMDWLGASSMDVKSSDVSGGDGAAVV